MTTYGAFGIIKNTQNQVLLVRRRDFPLWDLPGGTRQQGESFEDCVCREIREETGLTVTINICVGQYFRPLHHDKQVIFMVKLRDVNQSLMTEGPETKRLAYFSVNQLPNNLVALRRQQIRDALIHKHGLQVIEKENRLLYLLEQVIRKLSHYFQKH